MQSNRYTASKKVKQKPALCKTAWAHLLKLKRYMQQPSKSTRYTPNRSRYRYSEEFIAMLFEIAKNSKQLIHPSVTERVNQLWYFHITEYCIATKTMKSNMQQEIIYLTRC